jgi:hypothetical protein
MGPTVIRSSRAWYFYFVSLYPVSAVTIWNHSCTRRTMIYKIPHDLENRDRLGHIDLYFSLLILRRSLVDFCKPKSHVLSSSLIASIINIMLCSPSIICFASMSQFVISLLLWAYPPLLMVITGSETLNSSCQHMVITGFFNASPTLVAWYSLCSKCWFVWGEVVKLKSCGRTLAGGGMITHQEE